MSNADIIIITIIIVIIMSYKMHLTYKNYIQTSKVKRTAVLELIGILIMILHKKSCLQIWHYF